MAKLIQLCKVLKKKKRKKNKLSKKKIKDNLLITEKYNIQRERNRIERKEGITYGRYWKTEKVRWESHPSTAPITLASLYSCSFDFCNEKGSPA